MVEWTITPGLTDYDRAVEVVAEAQKGRRVVRLKSGDPGIFGRMTEEQKLIDEVALLIENHLAPAQLHRDSAGDAAVRRLARKVGRIDRLVRVSLADHAGRPPRVPDAYAVGGWLLERAEALAVLDSEPESLVKGRDLLAADLGLREGPELGRVLDILYEAQLDGRITSLEAGIELAREFDARFVVIGDEDCYCDMKDALADTNIGVAAGKQALVEAADTVTDMGMTKHAFKAGIKAQKGVEF